MFLTAQSKLPFALRENATYNISRKDMKAETESVVRSILSLDGSIDIERVNRAIDILHNRPEPQEELIEVLRIQEVARMLKVSAVTINTYANDGLLERVYGAGKFTLGISKKSYIRFTENRSHELNAKHIKPPEPKSTFIRDNQLKRDKLKRQIAWALRNVAKGSNLEKYEALIEYYGSHPGLSYTVGCEALGIPRTGFSSYRKRRPMILARRENSRERILDALRSLHPNKEVRLEILPIIMKLRQRHIFISPLSLKKIVDSEGYKRVKFKRAKEECPQPHEWYHDEDFVECD